MNSTLKNALAASLLVSGVSASAQTIVTSAYDYDVHCVDPNATNPYSADYGRYYIQNQLWGTGLGLSGTVAYSGACTPRQNGASVPVAGRIGFTYGTITDLRPNAPQFPQTATGPFGVVPYLGGSIQDDIQTTTYADGQVFNDDGLRLSFGMNSGEDFAPNQSFSGPGSAPSGGGWSFARVHVQPVGGAETSFLVGSTGSRVAFEGASNRYLYNERAASNGVSTRCVIDVLGDCARVSWRITNESTAPLNLGLWWHQWAVLTDNQARSTTRFYDDLQPEGASYQNSTGNWIQPYITTPGRRPITIDQRFIRASDPEGFPQTVNFAVQQGLGYGLQVVNGPTPENTDTNGVSDATPVDEFAIGDGPNLLAGVLGGDTNPTPNDVTFSDAVFTDESCYIQKWYTTPVPAGGYRDIVAYYRSTWGDSNYTGGYTAVVDTPKVINTDSTGQFAAPSYTIRVNVDTAGAYGIVDRSVPLQGVNIKLELPAGLRAVGSTSRTLNQVISNIPAVSVGATDFQIEVDPTNPPVGIVPYRVTITPTLPSGTASKVVTGNINVAATPLLTLRQGANLVTTPFNYAQNSWDTILGLTFNSQFQAFTWNAQTQQYEIQTGPERGRGTWIVAYQDQQNPYVLQGSPSVPTDQFPNPNNNYDGGAPLLILRQGWNLIGNPYNYSIPISQIIGVPSGSGGALTFRELTEQGVIQPTLARFDPQARAYVLVSANADPNDPNAGRLLPNAGYWVYAARDVTLSFPPVFDTFTRNTDLVSTSASSFRQTRTHWRLQLSAKTASSQDTDNFVGYVADTKQVSALNARKAPMAPTADAVRAYVTGQTTGTQYAQLVRSTRGRQTYYYNVVAKQSGPVTLSWPNIKEIPTNYDVRITDLSTRKTQRARTAAGLTYTATANATRRFQVDITPMGTLVQRVGTVATKVINQANMRSLAINYTLSSRGTVGIRVLQNGQQVGTVVADKDVEKGANQIIWPCTLTNGTSAPSGTYVLEITAVGEGGDTTRKLVTVNLR